MSDEQMNDDVSELRSGERLELLLDELRLTQTALADQCDVSPQYVNNIVRRGQRVTEDFAQAVQEVTGVNLNWLYLGEGPMIRGNLGEEAADGGIPPGFNTKGIEQDMRQAAEDMLQAADRLAEIDIFSG